MQKKTIKELLKITLDNILERKNFHRYKEAEVKKERISGHLITLVVFISGINYLIWCIKNADWQYWYLVIFFIASEFVFLILFILWADILWNKRYHRPEGPPLEKKNYSVDIFISITGEPVNIIEDTISAAININYGNKNVFILDDGKNDEIAAFCEKHGAHYLKRPSHENRKAGNLNYGLKHSNGDLILALDADQVVKPEIIEHIIGYFTIKHIALVQTAQKFKVPKNDPWGNSDEVFYKVMMPGKDYYNTAISCGSGVMYRREALNLIGGFSEWNLVEDLHTTMCLHDKGLTSVYHGIAYSEGTAPNEVISQVKQRWQWAVDSLRIFFWDNPIKRKGLNWKQKIQYFHFGFNYIAFGIFLPIFFIIPIWSLFTHNFMFPPPLWKYILARLPYFIFYLIFNRILTSGIHSFKIFQSQAGLFMCYFSACTTALKSKNKIPKYEVTSKITLNHKFLDRLYLCIPHIIFVLLSGGAIIYGILTIKNNLWFLFINVLWASWTIFILFHFIVLSLYPKWYIK